MGATGFSSGTGRTVQRHSPTGSNISHRDPTHRPFSRESLVISVQRMFTAQLLRDLRDIVYTSELHAFLPPGQLTIRYHDATWLWRLLPGRFTCIADSVTITNANG